MARPSHPVESSSRPQHGDVAIEQPTRDAAPKLNDARTNQSQRQNSSAIVRRAPFTAERTAAPIQAQTERCKHLIPQPAPPKRGGDHLHVPVPAVSVPATPAGTMRSVVAAPFQSAKGGLILKMSLSAASFAFKARLQRRAQCRQWMPPRSRASLQRRRQRCACAAPGDGPNTTSRQRGTREVRCERGAASHAKLRSFSSRERALWVLPRQPPSQPLKIGNAAIDRPAQRPSQSGPSFLASTLYFLLTTSLAPSAAVLSARRECCSPA